MHLTIVLVGIALVVLLVVALFVLFTLGRYIYSKVRLFWRAKHHPYYDRQLTPAEKQFLANAQQDLREFAAKESAVPRFYYKLYDGSYLPAMVIAWGLLYGIWYALLQFIHWPLMDKIKDGDVLFFDYDVGVSAIIALFLGIIFTGYCLCWITAKYKNFNIWKALEGGKRVNDGKDVMLTLRVDGIEDALRLKKLSPTKPFSSEDYLYDTSLRQQRAFGFITLALLAITVFFGFFDFRQTTVFYPDRLEYKSYWSGKPNVINYNDISDVKVSCIYGTGRGGRAVGTRITFNFQTGASYKPLAWRRGLNRRNYFEGFKPDRATVVNGAARLDSILRGKDLPFEIVTNHHNCFEEFVTRSRAEHRDEWRQILHMPTVSSALEDEN